MDKLQGAVSGGGPLSVSDAEFFLGMGIKVLEGFGLTETTPITNGNKPKKIKPGTVGPAVKDTIIKIGEDGEVLIKGPTGHEGILQERGGHQGGLHLGRLLPHRRHRRDRQGRLPQDHRHGSRTSSSPPAAKTSRRRTSRTPLLRLAFIEQVAVIGDNRKYLSALIVPSFADTGDLGQRERTSPSTGRQDLIRNPEVKKLYRAGDRGEYERLWHE
ncbi:MAG: AMP-binding protein [Desulfobacterales bacterium]|nr:AMP-binding protein [Desulfobacterales bacterium]